MDHYTDVIAELKSKLAKVYVSEASEVENDGGSTSNVSQQTKEHLKADEKINRLPKAYNNVYDVTFKAYDNSVDIRLKFQNVMSELQTRIVMVRKTEAASGISQILPNNGGDGLVMKAPDIDSGNVSKELSGEEPNNVSTVSCLAMKSLSKKDFGTEFKHNYANILLELKTKLNLIPALNEISKVGNYNDKATLNTGKEKTLKKENKSSIECNPSSEKRAFAFNNVQVVAEMKQMFKSGVHLKKTHNFVNNVRNSNINESIRMPILKAQSTKTKPTNTNGVDVSEVSVEKKELSPNFEIAFSNRLAFFEKKSFQQEDEKLFNVGICRMQSAEDTVKGNNELIEHIKSESKCHDPSIASEAGDIINETIPFICPDNAVAMEIANVKEDLDELIENIRCESKCHDPSFASEADDIINETVPFICPDNAVAMEIPNLKEDFENKIDIKTHCTVAPQKVNIGTAEPPVNDIVDLSEKGEKKNPRKKFARGIRKSFSRFVRRMRSSSVFIIIKNSWS